ncbi:helix-turn-helix transcriptional regulator [Limosilactobacillus fermentum]|uniref:helix-turn-helix transcriptional regulator n=1 Tax=Limosilactobacillus fermentum TaxID=1613 RepID=UPI003888D8C7
MTLQKSARLNQELIYLSDKHSFHLSDLMTTFKISKRTALRDIESLEQLGLALYSTPGPAGGYHLIQEGLLTKVYFNPDEIHAIFFALKAMSMMSETPFNEPFKQIRAKLLMNLAPNRQAGVLRLEDAVAYYTVPAVKHNPYLRNLLTIISHNHLASVTFNGQALTIQPYQLLYRDGYWLVASWDPTSQTCWNYRCDCLTSCQELASPLALTKQELQAKIKLFNHGEGGVKFKALLTEHGRDHFLRSNYPSMRLEENAGRYYLTGYYNERTFDYVVDYLLTFSNHAKLIEPQPLIDGYLKKLRTLLNQYAD